jgi:PAS domain S-box-containing protein
MTDDASERPRVFKVALAGGGTEAVSMMRSLETGALEYLDIRILGIADPDPRSAARLEGERMGIPTVDDPADLLALGSLDLVIDLTGDPTVRLALLEGKGPRTGVLDREAALQLGDLIGFLKQRERENHLERAFARTLAHATDEGVLVLDRDYRIQRINEHACRLSGLAAEEARGRFCYQVLRQATEPCQGLDAPCPMLETLSTGRSAHAIQEQILADGKTRYCDVTTYPLVDREGEVVQVLEVFRDITHDLSERLEARTRSIKDDLSRLVQEDKLIALGKLVASVAHEINNPIGSILNFSKLLQRSLGELELEPKVRNEWERWLELTVSEARRCGKIVGNLLSFSRQQGVEAREIDLVPLVHQITQLTAHQMELSGISLCESLPTGGLRIWGDPTPIQQCISNLVFNALEAMPDGGVLTIRGGEDPEAETPPGGGGPGAVWLEVSDTGEGITPEHRDHIFEPFFSTKSEGKGVGLGLSMVYGILREHGAHISVQSAPGEGATFRMSFPRITTGSAGVRAEEDAP